MARKTLRFIKVAMAVCVLGAAPWFLTGCATTTEDVIAPPVVSLEKELSYEASLRQEIGLKYKPWHDPRVEKLTRHVVTMLLRGTPDWTQALSNTKVHLYDTDLIFVESGLVNDIYLSRGALASLEFESELAFLLARELHLLKTGSARKRLEDRVLKGESTSSPADLVFSRHGIGDPGVKVQSEADRAGVQIIYRAYYDPRGGVSLIQRWFEGGRPLAAQPTGKKLPLVSDRLHTVRDEIAKLSPLRDPIVTSQAFDDLIAQIAQGKGR